MADQTARLLGFGSEEDRVNCPFYLKIGACRNGDRCNRTHNKPTESQTVLITNMYPNPPESLAIANDEDWDDDMYDRAQDHIEAFYEEVFLELATYGEIEDMVVLENVCEHMLGHVYVKYFQEAAAAKCMDGLSNRFFGPKLVQAEYTNVVDFREAQCRAFHETRCTRGGYCNFMHAKHIPKAVKRKIFKRMYFDHPEYNHRQRRWDEAKERERSRSPKREPLSTAEERRAMVAQWNKEYFEGAPPPPLAVGS